MPAEFSPPSADTLRRVRLLALSVAASLLVHLALVWLWPGYGGAGPAGRRLLATIRSMPAAQTPPQAEALPAETQIEPEPAREAAPEKPVETAVPESRSQQASSADVSEDAGGGRLSGYIPVELLAVKPRFLVDMNEYIPASLDASESGRIVVQLLIAEDGAVDGVVVEDSELSIRGSRRFVQRLNALRLAPGQRDGQAVKARWRLEFNFAQAGQP